MTLEWEEAKALVREAEAAGVKFCVAQNYRYNPVEGAISAILQNPSDQYYPGKIEIVDLIHHRYRPEPRTLNYPFAMVWDMSCHHVDLLNAWLGAASEVTAIATNPTWSAYEYDANINAIIKYESGALCNYCLTHAATISDYRLILQGERGAIRAFDSPGVRYYPKPQNHLGSSPSTDVPLPECVRSEQGVVNDFYKYITENIEPGISGKNNLKTLAVCEMLVRSAKENRTIKSSELS
jgi:predicted dehydrogenase